MTSKNQLQMEMDEAREARRLRNDILGDFFRDKQQQLFEAMQEVAIGDSDTLVNIHHQMKSLNALETELESIINTGKLAQAELNAPLDTNSN